ncbi:phage portal protein [Pedobacter sp. B4-66]|uniref:phage portal protein n=1 Tax=Pedobacter sp. B4-66 TaxID=2817280 RepID=UPI001BD9794E|nr:phage portal protein [Pedobacter sp. B4-66]
MKINDISPGAKVSDLIKILKNRATPNPDIKKLKKQLDPKQHDIHDHAIRPDKPIKTDKGPDSVKVARVSLALQKKIIGLGAAFAFGNPVKLNAEIEQNREDLKSLLLALKKVLKRNKTLSLDRTIYKTISSYKEVAEYWYLVPVDTKFMGYGFASKYKLRVTLFNPKDGTKLYPIWDSTGDFVHFSREFQRNDIDGKPVEYFETFTDEERVLWKKSNTDQDWVQESKSIFKYKKMPIVYGSQEEVEYYDVEDLISEIETLLSNFDDTIAYHAWPKIFVNGKVVGFAKKGETGGIIEGAPNTEAKYLSWDHAPESVKLSLETKLRMINTLTSTPDVSIESMKSIGAESGFARKMLFMEPHLKVRDKEEIYIPYMERRYSIIKTLLGEMNNKFKSIIDDLDIDPELTPYMIDDEEGAINLMTIATGGKPIVSQKTAIRLSGLVEDSDAELTQLKAEDKESKTLDVYGPPVE